MENVMEDHSSHINKTLLLNVLEGQSDISDLPQNACVACERASGESPVLMSVARTNFPVTEALINHGYSPNIQNYDGDFPLWSACFHGDLALVELLLQHGADINMLMGRSTRHGTNYHGKGGSVLEVAISNNRIDLARLLIHNGINVNLPDATYRCPLFNALTRGHTAITSLLLEHPQLVINISGPHTPSPLVAAVATGILDIVEKMVKKGAQIDCFGDDVRGEPHTPLTKACQMGQVEITELLLKNKASPNYSYTQHGTNHMYPLHYAVKYPYQQTTGLELVKLLVKYGTNVNQLNQYGETPVFMAVYLSSTYVLMYLIQHGAKVINPDGCKGSYDQRSPLELAIDFGYAKIALMLAECMTYFKWDVLERLKVNIGRIGVEAAEQLRQKVRNAQSLQSLCRGVIRETLGGQNVQNKVKTLIIPVHLRGYLCFDYLQPLKL